ncbi:MULTISPECIES: glycosyltransferase [unclassified Olleya]|jgi:uncharacterized protein YdcH (DUF465 family)|uniref:glycosyltransferase n=1 Tax=unclassified Olleya TaxID=2615019 RepID=UPI0011A4B4F2|nr:MULTISPECIES: glycosyltransferase [unclassified Olleya]TVZ47725.1 glycosyl transferase family 2 [Olleya sp. Hel_I_94]|tara:strand:+ start:4401 stop:4895 length:495 start_codon:yes stop_codon:yes gene_type:complete
MKTGIIIIFHNNEKQINPSFFIQKIRNTSNLKLCFVDNDSKDNTSVMLDEIKEACPEVSVVNIKKFKSDISAVRAGARYMSNQFNLNQLGYVSANMLNIKYHGLNGLIDAINENQELLSKFNIEELKKRKIKVSLFQSLFSIIDYLKKIKVKNQFIELQYLSKF